MAQPIYRRAIVKISGEALAGRDDGQDGVQDGGRGGEPGDFGIRRSGQQFLRLTRTVDPDRLEAESGGSRKVAGRSAEGVSDL